MPNPPVEMTGRQFALLTVLRPANDKPGYWHCRCDCGGHAVVRGDNLRSGRTKSCGCLMTRMKSRGKSILGLRFDRLIVLAEPSAQACVALCDCGNTKHVLRGSLVSGNTKSCGCLKADRSPWRPEPTRARKVWRDLQHVLRNPAHPQHERAVAAGLTLAEAWHDYATFLAELGEAPSDSATLQRIDRTRGFEPGNCQWSV